MVIHGRNGYCNSGDWGGRCLFLQQDLSSLLANQNANGSSGSSNPWTGSLLHGF